MQLTPLPALADNYIWALSADDAFTVFVDPGEAGPVLAAVERDGRRPAGVLLTHHHNDHIGGTAALLERWPDLPVIAPADARIELDARRVEDGERFELDGWAFEALAVPGHTRTHMAYYLAGSPGVLFCGDTLFSLGCGRLFEGTPEQMAGSLARLASLPGDTRICCGHEYTLSNAAFALAVEPGNDALRRRSDDARTAREQGRATLPTRLSDELDCNPFLRCDSAEVRAAVGRRLGRDPADHVETFAELRRWKDGFRP